MLTFRSCFALILLLVLGMPAAAYDPAPDPRLRRSIPAPGPTSNYDRDTPRPVVRPLDDDYFDTDARPVQRGEPKFGGERKRGGYGREYGTKY